MGLFDRLLGGESDKEKRESQSFSFSDTEENQRIPNSESEQIFKVMKKMIKYYNIDIGVNKKQLDKIINDVQRILKYNLPNEHPAPRKFYIFMFNHFLQVLSESMRYSDEDIFRVNHLEQWNELADLYDKVYLYDIGAICKLIYELGVYEVFRNNRDLFASGINPLS